MARRTVNGVEPGYPFTKVRMVLGREAGRIVKRTEIELDLRGGLIMLISQGAAASAAKAANDRRRRAVAHGFGPAPANGILGIGYECRHHAAGVPSTALAVAQAHRQRLRIGLEVNCTAETMPAGKLRNHARLP